MEFVSLGRVLFAFAFVIALLLGIAWLLKRFGIEQRIRNNYSNEGKSALQIEDSLYIDPKRRLLIVTRNDKRHLLLLNNNSQPDLLIESYELNESDEDK